MTAVMGFNEISMEEMYEVDGGLGGIILGYVAGKVFDACIKSVTQIDMGSLRRHQEAQRARVTRFRNQGIIIN